VDGCLTKNPNQLSNIPFLVDAADLISSTTIKTGYDVKVYEPDGVTPSTVVENDYKMIIEKNGRTKKTYTIQKQEVENKININGDYTIVDLKSRCGDINNSYATRRTIYFDAIEDSTYVIYGYTGDSVAGIGVISCKDSLKNVYFLNKNAMWDAGSNSCIPGPCDASVMDTITAKVTGRIFIECSGYYSNSSANPTYSLTAQLKVWVTS
jgi:hypothetical protein